MNASDPKTKLRAETVAMLRAVLISSPLGVPFEKLYRDYKQLTGKTIPYKELGFKNLENYVQSIPDVARAEKGPNGEWTLRGVASDADKHVAKLISKQKKPKVRKSAKLMISKRPSKFNASPARFNTPVKQSQKGPVRRFVPPRMQKQQKGLVGRTTSAGAGVTDLRQKLKGTDKEMLSRKSHVSGKSLKEGRPVYHNVEVSFSNTNSGRNVRTVTAYSPAQPCSQGILKDSSVIKWIKDEVKKSPNGLWATRLSVLFEGKFKKSLTEDALKELRSRPDLVRIEEPIEGRFLLYSPVKQDVKPEQQVSTVKQEESPLEESRDVELPYDLPHPGSTCMVYITHIENLGCFYVSRIDAITPTLNQEILKQYESTKYNPNEIPSIKPNQILCAQFTEDESFYRACVLEIVDRKHVKVLYVDFGNQEVIGVERLRALRKEFQLQPVQALHCCLDGVQPSNEDQEWSEASSKKFQEISYDKNLRMTVKDSEDKILSVALYDESLHTDIGDELVKAGVASSVKNLASTPSSSSSSVSSSTGAPSEKTTPPKKDGISRSRRPKSKSPGVVELPEDPFIDVLVCNITGTYDIYLRLIGDEYSKKFEAMQESMSCYYSDSKDEVTTEPAAGDLFALISDDVWCRVKVLNVKGSTINVFFVDHGDTAEATTADLRTLAPQFLKLPFQVFQCALNGLPKTRNPDVVDKLRKLSMGEICVAEVIKRTADLVFIELIDTTNEANLIINDVIRKLVIPDEELKPVLPKVGETLEVAVPYISPSGSVFLHVLGAGTRRLEELNEDLTDHYSSKQAKASEFVSNPTAGNVCCAKSEDGHWYRVKIISSSDRHFEEIILDNAMENLLNQAVEVLYVDYGNTDTVSGTNLREPTQANDHVLSLPFQVLECQLYDVPKDDWSEDLAKEMMDIISQGAVTAEVMSLPERELPSVSLLVTVKTKEDEEITERLTHLMGIAFDEEIIKNAIESEVDGDDKILSNGDEITEDERGKNHGNENETDDVKADDSEKNGVQQVGSVVNNEQDVQATESGAVEVCGRPISSKAVDEPSPWKELPLVGEWMDVTVTDVRDPDHFTFQVLPYLEEFYSMTDKMNEYYKNTSLTDEPPVEGGVYAAFNEQDDCWYRVVVESVLKNDKVYVLFVDYGDYATIDNENIQPLHEDFLELPCQGVQASLAGIKISPKTKWQRECIKHFKFLTLGRQLVVKVTSGHTSYRRNQECRVFVELYDTTDPSVDVSIAQKLIELKYAEAISS